MLIGFGRFARQNAGAGYFAGVEVAVDEQPPEPYIRLATPVLGFVDEGDSGVVPVGALNWTQGALLGVEYALKICSQENVGVVIMRIEGMVADTNPTVVAAAASAAVWQTLSFQPPSDVTASMEEKVFHSWERGVDALPHFEHL